MHRVTDLLLVKTTLPARFQAVSTGASPSNNGGACGGVDPDLSRLTDTAEAYGDAFVDPGFGAYSSAALIFVSSKQAAQAQALESAPDTTKCAAALARKFLKGADGTVTGRERLRSSARRVGGTRITLSEASVRAKIVGRPVLVQAALYFLRRGRALSEVIAYGTATKSSDRQTAKVVEAMGRRLIRSGF